MKRRELLTTATATAGASVLGMGALAGGSRNAMGVAYAQMSGESTVDRVVRGGKLRLGVDLTFPPLQFRDPQTKAPMGYCVEISEMIAKDLGVQIEWVELPFAQLVPAMLAGKFDWSGIGLTITPERAKSVRFITQTLFEEDSILLIKNGYNLKTADDLNASNVTISALVGSAQDASARLLWPKAQFRPLGQQEAMLDVASGRSTAALVAAWVAVPFAEQNAQVRIWAGDAAHPHGSIIHDINTFMVPPGDEKTAYWIDDWMRFYGAHRLQEGLWKKWLADFLGKIEKYSQR
jgi:polar amino acid transport system substrate-binding protein